MRSAGLRFMIPGLVIGPANATASSEGKWPSQPRIGAHAILSSVGVWVFISCVPTPRRRPSVHDRPGLWQLAQDCVPLPDRIGSQNSNSPRWAFACEYGSLDGNGVACGRTKSNFNLAKVACEGAAASADAPRGPTCSTSTVTATIAGTTHSARDAQRRVLAPVRFIISTTRPSQLAVHAPLRVTGR